MAQQVNNFNKKDLVFCGYDCWSRAVYLYKNKIYFKDISLNGTKDNIPDILHDSADNTFEGEPNNPYKFI